MPSAVYTAISTVPGAGRRRRAQNPMAPPPGYYDPAIDASVGSANRGLFDLGQDVQRNSTRLSSDYLTNTARANMEFGYNQSDLQRGLDRTTQDLGFRRQDILQGDTYANEDAATTRQRLDQDRARALEGVARKYAQMATVQREAGQASGVAAGGFFGAAKAARDTNSALDRQPIEQQYARNVEDLGTAQARRGTALGQALSRLDLSGTRANEDFTTGLDRATAGRDWSLADATLTNDRGQEDLATQLARGMRENVWYGQDALRSAYAQATANGWRAPRRRRR